MILWPWDSLVQPIRSYFARRTRSRWRGKSDKGVCCSCKLPFDAGKKRPVLDSCGHHRCYICLCAQDACPLCRRETTVCETQRKPVLIPEKVEVKDSSEIFGHKRLKTGTLNPKNAVSSDYSENNDQDRKHKRASRISNLSSEFSFDGTFPCVTRSNVTLKPLYFEVPQTDGDTSILYREWVYTEISKVIFSSNLRGIALIGDEGTGKTSLILQLVDWSSFGRKRKSVILNDVALSSLDVFERLASQLVGYHFCQDDCRDTCSIPEFVHSLAAQLCQAPLLEEYKSFLLRDESRQHILSIESCILDPDAAFKKGILEPLASLSICSPLFLVIDNVEESNNCNRFNSISSFLAKYISLFPSWLKVVVSINTRSIDVSRALSLYEINLNCTDSKVKDDLLHFIHCRIKSSKSIQTNVSACGDDNQTSRFMEYLVNKNESSFLFVKLILDLLQQNYLVIKSSSFKVIPVSVDEIFTLIFSLKFPSTAAFAKVRPVLEICLASLNPLTAVEIFYSVESARVLPSFSWENFKQALQALSGILIQRKDESLVISHPILRKWLLENKKFTCDKSSGHSYIALLYTRLKHSSASVKEMETIHHLSQSKLFQTEEDLKILWMLNSSVTTSKLLSYSRVIYWPDKQIIRMILKAGVDVNCVLNNQRQTILSLMCKLGLLEIVSLLLDFGADANKSNVLGVTPLMESASHGHLKVTEVLLAYGAKVHLLDKVGRCAVSFASQNGYLEAAELLLKDKGWPSPFSRSQAIQRAVIAAKGSDKFQMCEYLMKFRESSESPTQGSPTAFAQGQPDVCRVIFDKYLSKRDILILAAVCGYLPILSSIAESGNLLNDKDENGRTALSWACVFDKVEAVQFLLSKGADVNTKDNELLTPLHLASVHAGRDLVNLLLSHPINMDVKNKENKTPLECALSAGNYSSVLSLLKGGVTIGSAAFNYAKGHASVYSLLLDKLLSDGVSLYYQGRISEAQHRFKYALEKASFGENLGKLQSRLQEGILLCKNKMIKVDGVQEEPL